MALIAEAEKQRRQQIVASVLGTNVMEGITLDRPMMSALQQFESGAITVEEFSSTVRDHGCARLAARSAETAANAA